MFDSDTNLHLYESVLEEEMTRNKVSEKDIRLGIIDMVLAYAPISTNFENDSSEYILPDFSISAHRCGYLHKYAPLHTFIVLDVMRKILKQEILQVKSMLNSNEFKLCSLGGGPGSDVVGVMIALHAEVASLKFSATIIDYMEEWKYTFRSVIDHLIYEEFDLQWNYFLKWDYIGDDLLQFQNTTSAANNAINSASFITMIKFISAATCSETEPMVEVSHVFLS